MGRPIFTAAKSKTKKNNWFSLSRHEHSPTSRGVATNFRLGGGVNSGESTPPTPRFRFLLGFRPLYYGTIEMSKSFRKNTPKVFIKTVISGGYPPGISNRGDTFPASPPHPVATPMPTSGKPFKTFQLAVPMSAPVRCLAGEFGDQGGDKSTVWSSYNWFYVGTQYLALIQSHTEVIEDSWWRNTKQESFDKWHNP